MIKMPDWSLDRLRAMETPQLKQPLENARKREATSLAAQCEEVLAERGSTKPTRATAASATPVRRAKDFVSEYHFVCENDRGVTSDGEKFFWSGSWVVSEDEVIKSIREEAKLALHNSRNEKSYRQGKIIDYRRTDPDTTKKRNVEIEFLVAADDATLAWAGGESGYKWASDALKTKQA